MAKNSTTEMLRANLVFTGDRDDVLGAKTIMEKFAIPRPLVGKSMKRAFPQLNNTDTRTGQKFVKNSGGMLDSNGIPKAAKFEGIRERTDLEKMEFTAMVIVMTVHAAVFEAMTSMLSTVTNNNDGSLERSSIGRLSFGRSVRNVVYAIALVKDGPCFAFNATMRLLAMMPKAMYVLEADPCLASLWLQPGDIAVSSLVPNRENGRPWLYYMKDRYHGMKTCENLWKELVQFATSNGAKATAIDSGPSLASEGFEPNEHCLAGIVLACKEAKFQGRIAALLEAGNSFQEPRVEGLRALLKKFINSQMSPSSRN